MGAAPRGNQRFSARIQQGCGSRLRATFVLTMKLNKLAIPLLGLALGLPATGFAADTGTKPTPAPASTSLADRWHQMENDLDRVFHDTMKDLHLTGPAAPSQFGSTIDIREKPDAYEARIYVPKADAGNVKVTLKNGILDITAGDKAGGLYNESVNLPGPVQEDKMKVDNKDGFLLVTIPKDKSATAAAAPAPAAPLNAADAWDGDIIRQMERMQARMDQLERDTFASMPDAAAFANGPFLDSTVKLDDQKDQYVAHFYLPGNDTANAKVTLENNQLQLTATTESKNETTGANGAAATQYASGKYEESITLPGPVKGDKMKVDRKEGVVTVTLPKA